MFLRKTSGGLCLDIQCGTSHLQVLFPWLSERPVPAIQTGGQQG